MSVFVVPDNQMPNRPRYGEEVPRRDWQQNLGALTGAIEGHRAKQPPYQPVPAGTPTQRRQEADQSFTLQEAGATGYYQGKPTLQREQAASANALAAAGDSLNLPKTVQERDRLATATLLDSANSRYEKLRQAGSKHPLYYTINSMLRNPERMSDQILMGSDVKFVIDALIRSKAEQNLRSPEAYFSSPTGSKLWTAYQGLLPDKTKEDDWMYAE